MAHQWGNWGNSSSSGDEDTTKPARFKAPPGTVEEGEVKEPE